MRRGKEMRRRTRRNGLHPDKQLITDYRNDSAMFMLVWACLTNIVKDSS